MQKTQAARSYKLAASLVCANMLTLDKEIELMQEADIDYIHFDVMDGIFVPRYGLHPEILSAVRSVSSIPVDVHMMVADAEPYIDTYAEVGASAYVVHVEATQHLHRVIHKIKATGMKAGVALNPATPLSVLDYVVDDIDLVLLMAINPGILGHKLIPNMMGKIRDLRAKLAHRPDVLIEIDGGVTPGSAPEMLRAGANMLVCGTSTIFRPQEAPVDQKMVELRALLDQVSVTVA